MKSRSNYSSGFSLYFREATGDYQKTQGEIMEE